MPDFRVTMVVGALRAGVPPASVVPSAKAAAAELTMVAAAELAVVSGEARITIRFESEDDELAAQIADYVVTSTRDVVDVPRFTVTRRSGGRWSTVR